MADTTGIEWTDSTFNPWIGCTNISAGCDHCYAETMNAYRGWTQWGPHGERRRTSPATWANPRKWQAGAKAFRRAHGRRRRVFCASLADVFDNRAPAGAREDLFALIRETADLDWQLLTKRPENLARFLPPDWGDGYANVWLGTTTEDHAAYSRRWPILARTPARVRFLSYEPAIGPLGPDHDMAPDWIISGGESGSKVRIMQPRWARQVRDYCIAHDVAFFHKQWGDYQSNPWVSEEGLIKQQAEARDPKTNGKGGGLLDGRLWRDFPASIDDTNISHQSGILAHGAPLMLDLAP
jgi:protein gp37